MWGLKAPYNTWLHLVLYGPLDPTALLSMLYMIKIATVVVDETTKQSVIKTSYCILNVGKKIETATTYNINRVPSIPGFPPKQNFLDRT